MTSCSVKSMRSPIDLPLLRIDRCERQAALGKEVVPDVNWMLTVSSGSRVESLKGFDDL